MMALLLFHALKTFNKMSSRWRPRRLESVTKDGTEINCLIFIKVLHLS